MPEYDLTNEFETFICDLIDENRQCRDTFERLMEEFGQKIKEVRIHRNSIQFIYGYGRNSFITVNTVDWQPEEYGFVLDETYWFRRY